MPEAANHEGVKVASGRWWIASLLSLVGFSGLGILIGLAVTPLESDWMGARVLLPMMGGVLLGAILCVVFAAVSVVKGEKRCGWALLVGVPCLLCLVGSALALAQDLAR